MPTAADCRQQALLVVAACETVESLDIDRAAMGSFGIENGPIAQAIHDGGEQEKLTLQTLAGLCNELATELFRREQLCIEFTEDMARYHQQKQEWNAKFEAWEKEPSRNGFPNYAVLLPPPPFEGAEAG